MPKLTAEHVSIQEVIFQNHCYEVEESRGFPGLLTVYHLYTAEIVQRGLPRDNFVSIQYYFGKVLLGGVLSSK